MEISGDVRSILHATTHKMRTKKALMDIYNNGQPDLLPIDRTI